MITTRRMFARLLPFLASVPLFGSAPLPSLKEMPLGTIKANPQWAKGFDLVGFNRYSMSGKNVWPLYGPSGAQTGTFFVSYVSGESPCTRFNVEVSA